MDISESGRQIGEKLFALLDTEQQKDLLQYILNRENLSDFPDIFLCTVSKPSCPTFGTTINETVQAIGY